MNLTGLCSAALGSEHTAKHVLTQPPPAPYVGLGQREAQVSHALLFGSCFTAKSFLFCAHNNTAHHCTCLVHIEMRHNNNISSFLIASKAGVARAPALPTMNLNISTNRNIHITINRNMSMSMRHWLRSKYRSDSGCRQQLHHVSSGNWARLCTPSTRLSQHEVMQLLWQIACRPCQPFLQPVLPVLPPSPRVS